MSIESLRKEFPWPEACPKVPDDLTGWLQQGTAEMLLSCLPDLDEPENAGREIIAVELGAWKGLASCLLVNYVTHLICVDHWEGSKEHGKVDPRIHETWIRNTWARKEDITGIKMRTVAGMAKIKQHGIQPFLVYVDASHEYEDVVCDLLCIRSQFPRAIIVGDDYNWLDSDGVASVKNAVADFLSSCDHSVRKIGPGQGPLYRVITTKSAYGLFPLGSDINPLRGT